MNKLLKVIVVVVAILLVLPKYFGSIVETEHQNTLDKWSDNPAINVVSKNFTSHWFSGTATTEMVVLLQDDSLEDITLVVEEELSFGPLIFSDDGFHFALSHSKAEVNFKNIEELDPAIKDFMRDKIHLSSLFTFSKSIVTSLVVDEIVRNQGTNSFHLKGMRSDFTLTKENRIYGDFHWSGLSFKANAESVEVGEVSFNFDQVLLAGNYHEGTAVVSGYFDFVMSNIVATDNMSNSPLVIDNMTFKGNAEVVDGLMLFTLNYHADIIESFSQKFKHANLDLVFDRLNVEALKTLNEFLAGFSADTDALLVPENMEKFGLILEHLLSTDPYLKVTDLSVETPEGNIVSTAVLKIDKHLFMVANVMSLIQAFEVNFNLAAPEKFIQKVDLLPAAEQYIQQGLLRRENNEIVTDVVYTKGELTVNSTVIPL
ncbi:MAG: DUF945 family protein [Colwellia sp.]